MRWKRSPELKIELVTRNGEETLAAGNQLGNRLRGGEVITLSGPLGAGKTCFAKGVGKALEISPGTVASPTFILRAEYEGKFPLAHVDLYRLDSQDEIKRLGLFDQEDPRTVLVIEWPEKAESALPPHRVDIRISPEGESIRRVSMTGIGSEYRYLLNESK